MMTLLKNFLKKLSPVALSKNHRYDRLTKKIIATSCHTNSNCVDVGCHKGEILAFFLEIAPKGKHFAFEPLPYLFEKLASKYRKHPDCHIYNYAISNAEGEATFNHVITNPSYSGLKKRTYDRKNEKEETIAVITKKLDDIIPPGLKIDFIKIDTEGGDLNVLLGAKKIITNFRPLIIFEFGIGGSDIYGASPAALYRFVNQVGYKISLLDAFLRKESSLSLEEFNEQFIKKINYYFIAHPHG